MALLVSGTVVDGSGHPVGDARVAITMAPVEVADTALLTDEHGGFALAVPTSGTYRIEALTDRARAAETVEVTGPDTRVRLVLSP